MLTPFAIACCLISQLPHDTLPQPNLQDALRSEQCVQSLADRDSFIARAAIAELTRIGQAACGPLVEALQSQDLLTRRRAAHALSNIGPNNPDHVRILINALQDADVEVRRRAALALGRGKPGDGAVAALLAALHDRDITVRLSAAVSLGEIAPDSAGGKRGDEAPSQLRKAAREALRKFVSPMQHSDFLSQRKGSKP